MWLLKSGPDYILNHYVDSEIEAKRPYAILSHRWEESGEEIDFDEIRSGNILADKKGWYKLDKCRQQAREDDLDYVWIDTCCIDKRSSAELQESINSMYRWYGGATICYVYIRDVQAHNFKTSFAESEWFARGWTLQELIAPANVKFYDSDWEYVSQRHKSPA